MTTTVKILIEGNKACELQVTSGDTPDPSPTIVKPGQFGTRFISGEQVLRIKETGEFL